MQKKLEAQICVLKQTGNCVVQSNVLLPPVEQDLIQEQLKSPLIIFFVGLVLLCL